MLTDKCVKIEVLLLVYASFTLRLVWSRAFERYIGNNARTIVGSIKGVLKIIDALAINPGL